MPFRKPLHCMPASVPIKETPVGLPPGTEKGEKKKIQLSEPMARVDCFRQVLYNLTFLCLPIRLSDKYLRIPQYRALCQTSLSQPR